MTAVIVLVAGMRVTIMSMVVSMMAVLMHRYCQRRMAAVVPAVCVILNAGLSVLMIAAMVVTMLAIVFVVVIMMRVSHGAL